MPHKSLLIGLIATSLLLSAGVVLLAQWAARTATPQGTSVARGAIVDFNGVPLTGTVTGWNAYLNLAAARSLPDAAATRLFNELTRELRLDLDLAQRIAERPKVNDWRLPRRLSEQEMRDAVAWHRSSEWSAIPDLIRFEPKPQRTYPAGRAMSHVVGFVDTEGEGLEGLELQFNRPLAAGLTVRTSLESKAQSGVVEVLERAMRAHGLLEANAVVLEMRSGRVRSMVSLPTFEPIDSRSRVGEHVRLRTATDVFQAGPLLQPFLLSAALREQAGTEHPLLLKAFVDDREEAGLTIVRALGYRNTMYWLGRTGLLDRLALDFPGTPRTLVRTAGCPDDLLQDLGAGAGIAPTLARYATALLGELGGADVRSVKLGYALADSDSLWAPVDRERDETAGTLVERMVARARKQSQNPDADFGGMWATYTDRVEAGAGPRRASIVLFAPANTPTQLLVVTLRAGDGGLSEENVLEIGKNALDLAIAQ
jgi:cell division protein FtsI/penicillin-binding protein 2